MERASNTSRKASINCISNTLEMVGLTVPSQPGRQASPNSADWGQPALPLDVGKSSYRTLSETSDSSESVPLQMPHLRKVMDRRSFLKENLCVEKLYV